MRRQVTAILLVTFAAFLSVVGEAQTYSGTSFYYAFYYGSADTGTTIEPPMLQASDGNFYGAALNGSTEFIYQLTPAGAFSTLATLPANDAVVGLLQGVDGLLYGATSSGGSAGVGAIFSLTLSGTYTEVYSLQSGAGYPTSLIEAADGVFYLTTRTALLKFDEPSLTLNVLHTFADGYIVNQPLVQASDGNVYGTGNFECASGVLPSVYAIVNGRFSVLLQSSAASAPYTFLTPLTEGPDGYLYGVAETPLNTCSSNPNYSNLLYKFKPGGTEEAVVTAFPDGEATFGPLLVGPDGNLYGTYYNDGNINNTILFTVTLSTGAVRQLVDVPGIQTSQLIQGADGAFYSLNPGNLSDILRWGAPDGEPAALPAPVKISFPSAKIAQGQSISLTWRASTAFSDTAQICFASGSWSGVVPPSGSMKVTPSSAGVYDYSLTCGGSESSTARLIVTSTQAASTTSLSATPLTTSVGQMITVTATVASPSGGAAPSGTVAFLLDGQVFASLPLTNGVAQQALSTAAFPAGPGSLKAAYSGDAEHAGSTSAAVSLDLTALSPIAITTSPTPVGQNQTLRVAVSVPAVNGGPVPTGSVSLGAATAVLVNGSAVLEETVGAFLTGYQQGSISYGGDANYSAENVSFQYDVVPQPSVALKLSPSQVVTGSTVTATATLSYEGETVESGTVQFFANGTAVGAAQVSAGKAVLSASTQGVPPASYSITAQYQGGAQFGPATSPAGILVVGP